MKRNILYLMVVIAVAVSCSDEEQPTDSRATVSFVRDSLLSKDGVYMTLNDGSTAWTFEPSHFKPSARDTNLFLGPEVQTRSAGTLLVTFRILDDGGGLLSDGSFGAPLSPNWRWSFELFHAAADEPIDCGGCVRSDEFEIHQQDFADESIYVIWNGKGP